jgi:4-amino-4-deoxychorismate mutase
MSGLEPFRRRLDELDDQLARLLGERFAICREIALHKRAHAIPMMQPDRVAAVRERYLRRGAEVDLPADFTAALFELLIGATCKLEDEVMALPSAAPPSSAPPSAAFPPAAPTSAAFPPAAPTSAERTSAAPERHRA